MSGAGNTFSVVDARGLDTDFSQLARRLCGHIGCDGFMALTKAENADFRLHFYNSDGSRAAMCGNGARCICRFAYELGIAGPQMRLQTDGGPVLGWRLAESRYRVQLNDPVGLCLGTITTVTVGVPHAVLETDTFQREALLPKARRLRQALDANVDFYAPTAPGQVRVLTYERGVEAFTAACGTGCAAVAQAVFQGKPGHLVCHNPGGVLIADQTHSETFLTGPAEVLHVLELVL